jgi:hypothetical protein
MKLLNKPTKIKISGAKVTALGWPYLEKAIDLFEREIMKNKIDADGILVMVRGGMIPAVMLSHRLKMREMDFYQAIRTASDDPHDYGKFIAQHKPKITAGKKYLVIEDIIFKGETLNAGLKFIKSKGGKISAVASLLADEKYFTSDNFKINDSKLICAYQCEHKNWIRFPWESKVKGEKMI